MEQKKTGFTVVENKNPRGKNITPAEIKQALNDIKFWISKNASELNSLLSNSKAALPEQIQELENTLKQLQHQPPSSTLKLLLEHHNGNIPLQETFRTLSIPEIIESVEENSVQGFWNRNYIPFAADSENNILCLELESNGEETNVISWSKDIGVIEELSESLGLFIEQFANKLLNKQLEYVEGCGLIENSK